MVTGRVELTNIVLIVRGRSIEQEMIHEMKIKDTENPAGVRES